jgi:hypothetical protein
MGIPLVVSSSFVQSTSTKLSAINLLSVFVFYPYLPALALALRAEVLHPLLLQELVLTALLQD